MYYKTYYDSPLGKILLVCNETSLIGLWLKDQKYYSGTLAQDPILKNDHAVLHTVILWLDAYFNLQKPTIYALSLAPIGSAFRQRVWKILCNIPYGKIVTYGDIAKQIASENNINTMSAQAVGNAVAHNPISIIIPCHRVVGAHGSLTGYAGGIDKKVYLLTLENVNMSNLYEPNKGSAL